MLHWLYVIYLRLLLWWRFTRHEPKLLAEVRHGVPDSGRVLKERRANRGAWIARGCTACAACGGLPFGMLQPRPGHHLVEIGCLACPKGRRVRERTRADAVFRWNKEYGS